MARKQKDKSEKPHFWNRSKTAGDIEDKSLNPTVRPRTLWDVIESGRLADIDCEIVHYNDGDGPYASVSCISPESFTDAGRREWADVLNARVVREISGPWGYTVAIDDGPTDRDMDRVRDFVYAYAGYCSESDSERWFRYRGNGFGRINGKKREDRERKDALLEQEQGGQQEHRPHGRRIADRDDADLRAGRRSGIRRCDWRNMQNGRRRGRRPQRVPYSRG